MPKQKTFNYKDFIAKIISFSPRQLEGETKTAKYLIELLKEYNIPYKEEKFSLHVPLSTKASLIADDKSIACLNSSFVSGSIDRNIIISSMLPSSVCQDQSNINFNPNSEAISIKNQYFAPSIAISKNDIDKIIKAKNVKAEVKTKKIKHTSSNIIIGNYKKAKTISFAHYDSILKGAIDNASGVAIMMKLLIKNRDLYNNHLFVFSGAEELSYDKPVYWGRGFRVFENKYLDLMKKCQRIIVIDCVGASKTQIINDPSIVKLGFPIKNAQKLANKISFITSDLDALMSVYHSEADDASNISEIELDNAYKKFLNLLTL